MLSTLAAGVLLAASNTITVQPPTLVCGSPTALLEAHADRLDGSIDQKHEACAVIAEPFKAVVVDVDENVITLFLLRIKRVGFALRAQEV